MFSLMNNSDGSDIIVNFDNVLYITKDEIVFNNGATLKHSGDINDIYENIKNTKKDFKECTDPNRYATEKMIKYALEISQKLNISKPKDSKFITIRDYLNKNVPLLKNQVVLEKKEQQLQPQHIPIVEYEEVPF